jgi:hypothetical protein
MKILKLFVFNVVLAAVLGAIIGCAVAPKTEFPGTLIVADGNPESIEGSPLTAVVVTQCNQLLVVYITLPTGELVRIDQTNGIPWDQALSAANSALRSERVEVSCNGQGAEGYEKRSVSLTNL